MTLTSTYLRDPNCLTLSFIYTCRYLSAKVLDRKNEFLNWKKIDKNLKYKELKPAACVPSFTVLCTIRKFATCVHVCTNIDHRVCCCFVNFDPTSNRNRTGYNWWRIDGQRLCHVCFCAVIFPAWDPRAATIMYTDGPAVYMIHEGRWISYIQDQ